MLDSLVRVSRRVGWITDLHAAEGHLCPREGALQERAPGWDRRRASQDTGGSPSTEGRFRLGDVHLETKPVQQNLPIYLAAIGPKALKLAGALADGVLLNAYTPVGYVRYASAAVGPPSTTSASPCGPPWCPRAWVLDIG